LFYGWYVVIASCLIVLYSSGTVYLGFTSVIQPVIKEFGWSYAEVSFASSLRGLEVGLLVPVAGMLIDKLGQRKVVFAGAILASLGLVLLSRTNSLLMFYLSFVLIAAGLSTTTTSLLMSAVSNWFRKRAGLAMGITASGVSLGGLMLPFITLLIDSFGWRNAVAIMGLGMLVIPLPLSLVLRHKPEQYGCLPDGVDYQSAPEENNPSCNNIAKKNFSAMEALKSRTFWFIAIGFVSQVFPVAAITTHIMPYLNSIGIQRGSASFIAGCVSIATIIGRIGFGWIGDRIDKRKVAAIAFAMTSLGVLILDFISADRYWMIFIFIPVYSIGWGGAVPMLSGLLKEYYGGERLGTIVGCLGSVMMLGQILGPLMAGWVFDKWGSYQYTWFLLFALVGTSTIIFYTGLMKTARVNRNA
jgi:MFS family permease